MTDDPFVTHRSLLFTVAYEMLGSAADAEDVVQETWLPEPVLTNSDVADDVVGKTPAAGWWQRLASRSPEPRGWRPSWPAPRRSPASRPAGDGGAVSERNAVSRVLAVRGYRRCVL
jgi:hypothetical protein